MRKKINLRPIPSHAVTNYKGRDGYLVVVIKSILHTGTGEGTLSIVYYHSPTMPDDGILVDYWVAIYRCSDGVMLAYSCDFFSKLQSVVRPLGDIADGR